MVRMLLGLDWKSLKRGAKMAAPVALLLNGTTFVWWAGSSFSWGMPLPGSELALIPVLVALALGFVGFIAMAFDRARHLGVSLTSAGAVYVLSFVLARFAGHSVRNWGFERFAKRTEPLVTAIRAYSEQHGAPPTSLAQLVPTFLPAVPTTGVGSAPYFGYNVGSPDNDGNPWYLYLEVGTGVLNWDRLLYYPLQNYPKGGSYEPIADWAYFHE